MKRIALVVAFLGGCATGPLQTSIDKATEAYQGAGAMATTLAEQQICVAMPVGEWVARYGDPEKAAAWRVLCSKRAAVSPPAAPAEGGAK